MTGKGPEPAGPNRCPGLFGIDSRDFFVEYLDRHLNIHESERRLVFCWEILSKPFRTKQEEKY